MSESDLDPYIHEGIAAANLAELLDRLSLAKGEQPLHPDLRVSISWVGASKAQTPSESFRRFWNAQVQQMLPDMRSAWLAHLQGSVDLARQNLAEIQKRGRAANGS